MYISEIVRLFHEDGVDDFEIKKIGDLIIFGYFNEYPINLIVIKKNHITEIVPPRNDSTKWMYELLDKNETIIDDIK